MAPRLHDIAASPRPAQLPLSDAQQRLWFVEQLEGTSAEYNLVQGLRLRGALDRAALGDALDAIVARHEMLRTRFVAVDGVPMQVIDPPRPVAIRVDDLQEMDPDARQALVTAALRAERETTFDLRCGPLMRVRLLRLMPDEHVLVLAFHHIVSDGWSEGVFNRELFVLYDSRLRGEAHGLPDLPLQYADFARWQQESADPARVNEGLQYWAAQLSGIPESASLAGDRRRQPARTFDADRHETRLVGDQLLALKQCARRHNVSLIVVLLTAWAALVSRYSGEDDVVVGAPIANRHHEALENLIGFFVNTLPLRVRVEPAMTFRALLAEARRVTLEAYRYQDVPFERIVEAVAPKRALNTTPIFQVLLNLENYPWHVPRLAGLDVTSIDDEAIRIRFDLELDAKERGSDLMLSWSYNRDLFDAWRIEQMARHYVRIVDALVANADQTIGAVRLTTAAEDAELLAEWDAAPRDRAQKRGAFARPPRVLAHEWWKDASRRAESPALECGPLTLTYGDLQQRSDAIAHAVAALAPAAERFVGVGMVDRVATAASILAIMKTGRAFVPLDAEMPDAPLREMIDDAGVRVVLTDERTRERFDRLGIATLTVGECTQEGPFVPVGGGDDDPCALYFTSASTGRSKGVIIRLPALHHHAGWVIETLQLAEGTRITQLCRPTFIGYLRDLFVPLCAGGTICIPPDATIVGDGHRVATWLADERIEVMACVPTILRTLLHDLRSAASLPALRWVLVTGEPLLAADIRRWYATFDDRVKLVNLYGATETALAKLAHVVAPGDERRVWTPVGRAMPGAAVTIADDDGRPCPKGVVGEIRIWSPFLSGGYYGQPTLTAERFLADASASDGGGAMFRTGDLGRIDGQGSIEYVGRRDGQEKVRGVRVDLRHIENVLAEQSGVREAVVVVHEDQAGERRLVAYVVATERSDTQSLRSALERRLPASLIPTRFVFLDRLPLTVNGKVNRLALPSPDLQPASPSRAPETTLEEVLCDLFADVLGIDEVGPTHDFFDLGGHSLMTMRLMSRIRLALGVELTVQELFERASVAALLDPAHGLAAGVTDDAIIALRPAGTLPALFCIDGHEGVGRRFSGLLRYVGRDHAVYALQPPDGLSPDVPVEQSAAEYLRHIVDMQPTGPYHLFGAGAGAAIAVEVAGRLQRDQQRLGLVAVHGRAPRHTASRAAAPYCGDLLVMIGSTESPSHVADAWRPYVTGQIRCREVATAGVGRELWQTIGPALATELQMVSTACA